MQFSIQAWAKEDKYCNAVIIGRIHSCLFYILLMKVDFIYKGHPIVGQKREDTGTKNNVNVQLEKNEIIETIRNIDRDNLGA